MTGRLGFAALMVGVGMGAVGLAPVWGQVGGAGGAGAVGGAGGAGVPVSALPYQDTGLSFEKRAADLVGRMTLQQKARQVQWMVHADGELGLPAVNWWTEALHGDSRAGVATVYPQAIGMAAAWDPGLMQKVGSATADEARAKFQVTGQTYYGLMLWAPTINMARDPRWGRVEETFGEDPYLTGQLSVAMVRGMQGDDPKYLKTVATPKHFAMNSQEAGRNNRDFDVPDTVLHDYYLPAFRDSFMEGKAASTMAAFNGINGVPCAANRWLLTTTLRDQWGFEGAVVTDYNATREIFSGHHYVQSDTEAIAAAIEAGVDVICDPRSGQPVASQNDTVTNLIMQAVTQNQLSVEALDKALLHNLMVRFRLGMFDPPGMVPFTPKHPFDPKTDTHPQLALKMAQECFVLLKNDAAPRGTGFERLLPLNLQRMDSVALVGPCINSFYLGAYSGTPSAPVQRLADTLRQVAGDRLTIRSEPSSSTDAMVAAASKSDVVIFACGLNGDIEHEGIDRSNIALPAAQQAQLEKVVAANPNTIVVLQAGSPVGLEWMKKNVPAILLVWYPGEQGAEAMAQMLVGQVNPSGRLPLTFYRAVGSGADSDVPAIDDYDITKGRTYMYLKKKPCYVFGHGLSYTQFEYRNLKVPAAVGVEGVMEVEVEVANTGGMDGDEVVQVYVSEVDAAAGLKRPMEQLKGFLRVSVGKGKVEKVKIAVPVSTLGFWSVQRNKYVVDPGEYEVRVGGSSEDIRGVGRVRVE